MSHDQSHAPEGLPSYLGRLTQAPLLTIEEEQVLTRQAREGDISARQRLVESNMRLVINIARTYHSRAIPLEDLIQEGAIGLIQAIERFDPDKGFRFSTYATHWVRQSIGRAIDNKAKAIRLPAHVVPTLRKVEKLKLDLTDQLGREPSLDILARESGLEPGRLQAMLSSAQEVLSLDMKVGETENSTLGSLIRAGGATDPEGRMMESELLEELGEIVQKLDEGERRILALRLAGLTGQTAPSGEGETLSRERRRQIEAQAIRKLRALASARRLREFLTS
jgi:RNA polymerase primary sigma factor